ncbi:MAG: PD40 domain-containing protein [Candidatus Kapabacteria bacterium]|nr:PD40 domain-containing protein [Candidatus Kapabacteria bacterium]
MRTLSTTQRRWLLPIVNSILLSVLTTMSVAQGGGNLFGKNKVQYERFDWKFVSSKHFDVYFNPGLQYVAEFCAIKAEDALTSLNKNLGYRVTKRLSFIVYGSHNQFQQTNVLSEFMPEGVGGVTELFKNRIVIPFEGDWEKFRHVIHHELVHAYLNEMFYGGSLQTALNSRLQIPLWMNEGLAEYESIGGMDVATDMFMRDITNSEYLPPLTQLNGYFAYRGGQTFYSYVADKYGKGKVGELINRLRSLGDPNITFKNVFGKDMAEFSEQWEEDMKTTYWVDREKFKKLDDFAKRMTNHTKEGSFYNTSPVLNPTGDKVAFISDRDDDFAIYWMDVEKKSEPKLLVSSQRALDFEELNILTPGISWDPTGKKLAITAKAGGEDALYIIDVASGNKEKFVFNIKTMTSAQWSPDGKYIAVVAVVNEQPDIYLFDVKLKTMAKLTDDIFTDSHPVWTSDNRYIYFVSDRGTNIGSNSTKENFKIWNHDFTQSDVYMIDVFTKNIERITFDPENKKSSIAVSNDGKKMLFVSDKNGIGNMYDMELQTKKVRPKTNSMSGIAQITLAKDESKLLFSAQNKGGYDIFMIRTPFEKNLDNEELPLTKFKSLKLEQARLANAITEDTVASEAPVFKGYGTYGVEFTRQQSVSSNRDIPNQLGASAASDGSSEQKFVASDYKVTITNDLIFSQAGYNGLWGTGQGTIQMLFSDLMGDHQIYSMLNLWYDLNFSNIFVQYSYNPEIIDYSVSIQHNALLWSLYQTGDGGLSGRQYINLIRNYGASLDAQYPISRFQRFDFGVRWLGMSRSNLEDSQFPTVVTNYIIPSAQYVFDNTQFGFFAPYKGTRLNVGGMWSPFTSRFFTLTTDIRKYVPLYKYLYGFAFRAAGGASLGPNPRMFYAGGADFNWINRRIAQNTNLFTNPEDFAFLLMPMPLRGFAFGDLAGTNYFLFNGEFRFPLIQALAGGALPLAALGAIFVDCGSAFSGPLSALQIGRQETYFDDTQLRQLSGYRNAILLSTGLGIRTALLGLPLKIDIAWRREQTSWSEPYYLFSLGMDF